MSKRYCVECLWYRMVPRDDNRMVRLCAHADALRNLVTGEPLSCSVQRLEQDSPCGPEGKLWAGIPDESCR